MKFLTLCPRGGAFDSLYCPKGRVFVQNDCFEVGGFCSLQIVSWQFVPGEGGVMVMDEICTCIIVRSEK